jgi:phage gp45-like
MRFSTRTVGDRMHNAIKRVTVETTNEDPKFREAQVSLYTQEKQKEIEHFEPYGLTSRVKQPTQGQGGAKEKAEGLMVFTGGNRSHGALVVVGDRRYRLKGLKEGEVALYDDQGQKVHITRDGTFVDGGQSKKPVTVTVGNATAYVSDGQIKTKVGVRAVYIRNNPDRIDLGKKDAPHAVMTADGPSLKVFAVIDENDDG